MPLTEPHQSEPAGREDFRLRYAELDHEGHLSFLALCRLLQEAAGRHTAGLRLASYDLREQGLTWILSRMHVRVLSPRPLPRWRDLVSVYTWRATIEKLFAVRDFRMEDENGEVLAIATTHWPLLNIERRRLVPIPSAIADNHPRDAARALPTRFAKIETPQRVDHKRHFSAGHFDLDDNGHVNNIAYIRWALEALPQGIWQLSRLVELEVLFRNEIHCGDALEVHVEERSEQKGTRFVHQLVGRDETSIAELVTTWQPRGFHSSNANE